MTATLRSERAGAVMPLSQGQSIAEHDIGPFRVVESVHGGGLSLLRHCHEWPTVTIVLDGEFAEILPDGPRWCQALTVLAKPAGVPHSNWYGQRGARCLIAEMRDTSLEDGDRRRSSVPTRVLFSAHGDLSVLGRRIARACGEHDDAARMTAEALLREIAFGRGDPGPLSRTSLQRALDYLHAEFRRPLRLRDVAGVSGVHPTYLARGFRLHFGRTPGDLLRELRVHWAGHLLVETDLRLSEIALESGFADQSHLTRVFRGRMRCTPARYRQMRKSA
ncbi:MAG: AraC family transcriptional regulator [Gemmatimonadales bacterium]|nr:AraC family transcriptional regulator [Gemmatimonadales bacterium]